MFKDFFLEHKKLLYTFIVSALILICISTFVHRSLFFDAPAMFMQFVNQENDYASYFMMHEQRTRLFSNFLLALPYNLIMPFIPDNLLTKMDLFCFSYQIALFGALIVNYFIAKRTKRYDIAALALVFYTFFYLPNSIWYVKELHFAIMMQFILLQYFLTKSETLNITDYFLIAASALFCFESYENQIIFAITLSALSLFYVRKNIVNKKIKLIIGLASIFIILYSIFKLFYAFETGSANISFTDAFIEYKNAILITFKSLFTSCLIYSSAGIIICFATIFLKRKYNTIDYIIILLLFIISTIILGKNTGFIPNTGSELQYYMFAFLAFISVTAMLIIADIFGFDIKNQYYYGNVIVTACIVGFFHILWQTNSCIYSYEYVNDFRKKLQSDKIVETWNDEDRNKRSFVYDTCFGTELRSLILSPNRKIETILMESREYCSDIEISLDKEKDILYIHKIPIVLENKYWDLKNAALEIEEYLK